MQNVRYGPDFLEVFLNTLGDVSPLVKQIGRGIAVPKEGEKVQVEPGYGKDHISIYHKKFQCLRVQFSLPFCICFPFLHLLTLLPVSLVLLVFFLLSIALLR